MTHVLAVLNVLCEAHDKWFYRIARHIKLHLEHYRVELIVNDNHRIVITNTYDDNYVDVWCDTYDSQADGDRVKKSALLEYLLYIIQEEYGD
jgi:hypothetical protein